MVEEESRDRVLSEQKQTADTFDEAAMKAENPMLHAKLIADNEAERRRKHGAQAAAGLTNRWDLCKASAEAATAGRPEEPEAAVEPPKTALARCLLSGRNKEATPLARSLDQRTIAPLEIDMAKTTAAAMKDAKELQEICNKRLARWGKYRTAYTSPSNPPVA